MTHENPYSWWLCKLFMKITGKEFHGNFMTSFSTMKSEIAIFMAMKKKFTGFSTHFHGIFMKKTFLVRGVPIELRGKLGSAKL